MVGKDLWFNKRQLRATEDGRSRDVALAERRIGGKILLMDRLNIISWNVRGLGGSNCYKVMSVFRRQLRKSLVGRIDILLIQEHH